MRIDLLEAFGLDPKVIAILKEKYGAELLPIQERAFKEHQILGGGNFLLSAVTSSGKTLVGEILALHFGSKGKRVFYLVPTKALAEEKFEQFREDYEKPASRPLSPRMTTGSTTSASRAAGSTSPSSSTKSSTPSWSAMRSSSTTSASSWWTSFNT